MKLLNNLFMKTFYREVEQHLIQYKITYTMVYNNLGYGLGCKNFFNMVYTTDYTEKGYTYIKGYIIYVTTIVTVVRIPRCYVFRSNWMK